MKYDIGDRLLINIRGYNDKLVANESEDGTVKPIGLYEIDPAEDGRPRRIAEEVLDYIIALGADLYSIKEVGMKQQGEDGLVEVGEIVPGTTIEVGGVQMEILDIAYPGANGESGILCLAKDVLFQKEFDEDNCNNWRISLLRVYLNGEFKYKLEKKIGEGMLIPFKRDLVSDDGLKDYCEEDCIDMVSLISCDEYRAYREHISNKSDWWWTLTAYSTPYSGNSRYVRFVYTDGSLNRGNAYCGSRGVAPAFLLLPSLRVKIIEDKED